MKKSIFIAFVAGVFLASCGGNTATTGEEQEVPVFDSTAVVEYNTVSEGSHINWRASHLAGTGKRFGKVTVVNAQVKTIGNKVATATIVLDINSITVENFPEELEKKGNLEGHLKNADFFDAEKYPTTKFEVTKVEVGTGDYNSIVTGNLTIKDSTKSITFNANITVTEESVTVKSEDFTVNRLDWGLTYNVEGTKGLAVEKMVSNDLGFTIDATIKK